MFKRFGKKAQSAMELTMLTIVFIAALLAMQNYFKRGIQGRMKTSVDSVGDQYDPLFTTGDVTQRLVGNTVTNISVQNTATGKETLRGDISTMTETRQGFFRVDAE